MSDILTLSRLSSGTFEDTILWAKNHKITPKDNGSGDIPASILIFGAVCIFIIVVIVLFISDILRQESEYMSAHGAPSAATTDTTRDTTVGAQSGTKAGTKAGTKSAPVAVASVAPAAPAASGSTITKLPPRKMNVLNTMKSSEPDNELDGSYDIVEDVVIEDSDF